MTAQQATNLNVLQNFLSGPIPRGRLNMNQWQEDKFAVNECGTKACALGWACTIPALQAQGLRMDEQEGEPLLRGCYSTHQSVARLFGVRDLDDYLLLFGQNGPSAGRRWVEADEAAEGIREYMRASGYEPTVIREEEFAKFMERTTEPVALTV